MFCDDAKSPVFAQKCTCAHLNAVNMQDKLKFKNCDITGVINAECHHIYILSMVDLQKGERCVVTIKFVLM